VVVVAAIPTHLFLLARTLGPSVISADGLLAWAGGPMGAATSLGVVTATGLAATAVPLALGLAAFRRLEA
jgi:hypothetical protein